MTLQNGRQLVATGDHRIRTREGWTEAASLRTTGAAHEIACSVHVGVPHERSNDVLLRDITGYGAEELCERMLLPLHGADPRIAPLVRLLGLVSGGGHLSRDGKAVSVYTVWEADAASIAADFGRLGWKASIFRRARERARAGRRDELCIRVSSRALHALFSTLGSPTGPTAWTAETMSWLFRAPAWVRAQFLSGLASSEMTTPRIHGNGVVPNLQLKQAGDDDHAIRFVARLLDSLGFATSVANPSGREYGRQAWVLQILGGRGAQVKFAEQVGFCHAAEKRRAAARVASVVWNRCALAAARTLARDEARALHAAGARWEDAASTVTARHGVSAGFAYHAIDDWRGAPRVVGTRFEAQTDGEICWVPVLAVEPCGEAAVYDVVTADCAESFFANGIVVHNCGNAAIRTDLTLQSFGDDAHGVHRTMRMFADEIQETVSFGIGRKNRSDDAPIDHDLFRDPSWDAVPPKHRLALLSKAREQLGTVGSGNHYVDVFADENARIWVGVHFGSRGLGHTIVSAFLALGQGKAWGERVPETETLLDIDAPIGHDYWHLMNLAGRYAYAGREWVARKVVALLGGTELELVHNHHNFAWKETHAGEEVVVIRKGATPAYPGQPGRD